MMLCRFREALEDSQQAVRLDDCFMKVGLSYRSPAAHNFNRASFFFFKRGGHLLSSRKGHLREGKCHLSLGNAMAAARCFQKVLDLEPSNQEAQQEVGKHPLY